MNHGWHCPTFAIEVAEQSDLGMRRLNNQDALAVVVARDGATWQSRGHLLMVADGMGAHAAGELASKMAADNIPHAYLKLRDLYPPAALRQAIRDVNALIYSKGQSTIGFQGMGTTCSCLVLLPQGALVAHVGDSRVYRLRGNRLVQLTFDHSLVWEMAAAGHMSEDDVPAYIPKNVITRSLGPHENVNVDLEGPFDAIAGDVFLLCSDGLSGQVTDAEIGVLLSCLPLDDAVQTLVDLANLRGGPDNISIIAVRVTGTATAGSSCATPAGDTGAVGDAPPRESVVLPATSIAALFVLLFCLVNSWWIASALAGAALATALGLQFSSRGRQGGGSRASVALGGPYGNGPYRDTLAEPDEKFVASLAELAAKLRGLPTNEGPSINWQPIDDSIAVGREATARGDHGAAVGRYAAALRSVMQQIRQHRLTTTDDAGAYRV